jgi:LysM repeat protein
VPRHDPRRYAAPAAFLLAVTIAVVLIRAGLHSGGASTTSSASATAPSATEVSGTTTTATTSHKKRYWTVQAGDTFGSIATKTGVPVSRLQRLNPKVSSTSLFIGERIRIG